MSLSNPLAIHKIYKLSHPHIFSLNHKSWVKEKDRVRKEFLSLEVLQCTERSAAAAVSWSACHHSWSSSAWLAYVPPTWESATSTSTPLPWSPSLGTTGLCPNGTMGRGTALPPQTSPSTATKTHTPSTRTRRARTRAGRSTIRARRRETQRRVVWRRLPTPSSPVPSMWRMLTSCPSTMARTWCWAEISSTSRSPSIRRATSAATTTRMASSSCSLSSYYCKTYCSSKGGVWSTVTYLCTVTRYLSSVCFRVRQEGSGYIADSPSYASPSSSHE